MEARLDYSTISPEAMRAMNGLERVVRASKLEPALLELVRLRASQINGWNRFGVSFRDVPGSYQPEQPVAATS